MIAVFLRAATRLYSSLYLQDVVKINIALQILNKYWMNGYVNIQTNWKTQINFLKKILT
jgi:hypothetical protein